MRHQVRLSVQEQYLRGDSMLEKWAHAQQLGFDAVELRGAGDGAFAARLPELTAAAAAGVMMPPSAWRCSTSSEILIPSAGATHWSR